MIPVAHYDVRLPWRVRCDRDPSSLRGDARILPEDLAARPDLLHLSRGAPPREPARRLPQGAPGHDRQIPGEDTDVRSGSPGLVQVADGGDFPGFPVDPRQVGRPSWLPENEGVSPEEPGGPAAVELHESAGGRRQDAGAEGLLAADEDQRPVPG